MDIASADSATIDGVDRYVSPAIWVNPARLGGEPCFADTRVPVRALFDHLRAGDGYEAFLDGYEGVTREQVVTVIALAERLLTAEALVHAADR